jgi:hypothetical protein
MENRKIDLHDRDMMLLMMVIMMMMMMMMNIYVK